MKQIILALFIPILFFSCKKEQSDTNNTPSATPLSRLQNLWILDSVILYPNSNVYGNYLFAFKPFQDYVDFRKDGKVYSYGGSPMVSYDTAAYELLSNNTTLLISVIKKGIAASKPDTAHIMKLTDHALMYRNRNPVGEHGRWVLKR
jgi:hypothetical protein